MLLLCPCFDGNDNSRFPGLKELSACGWNINVCTELYRRAVPLAVALLSVSDPSMATMDTLSRLSHDGDQQVAQNAVIALGTSEIPVPITAPGS